MAPQNPSGMLAESIATFSQAAYKAFAEIETQCKSEVARATTQAKDAKIARDEALAQLHEMQLEDKSLQQEVIALRAGLKQMEMTIAHQADTIAQLRREANQWKDQSKNWQDHFLRVEQERCALGTKVDELLTDRLHGNFAIPISPSSSDSISQATTAVSVKRHSSSHPPSKPIITPDPESPTEGISAHRQQRSIRKQPKPIKEDSTRTSIPPPPKTLPGTQTVIRRVQAVYEVKEESSEEELEFFTPKQQRTAATPRHIKSESSQRRRKRLVVEEDNESDTGYPEDSVEPSDAIEPPPEEDDDDELMMGAEDNHHEVYGTKRVPTTKRGPPQTQSASPKKRKRASNARAGRDVKRKT
ncbi:hypothetical protein BDN72DRAFT_955477 [Pluteus cervinus]|uniref:Uncharacterized protein n=1 Tax=Pluteus cervinus TaxID=181527 RepID=A0ACD3B9I2_9AGAR|nr:hypothetical protein BDN72DRAFT_955477 [Pluteus cervinus]